MSAGVQFAFLMARELFREANREQIALSVTGAVKRFDMACLLPITRVFAFVFEIN